MRSFFILMILLLNACARGEALFEKYVIQTYGDRDHGWRRASGTILENPVLADERSMQKGAELFKSHCSVCHGDEGKGDGPYANKLSPAPANLQDLVKNRNEYHIFLQITGGRDGMPIGATYLSDRDRWDIVNYIETFKANSF